MAVYQQARQTHSGCMVCGSKQNNADSLDLVFESDGETGVKGLFNVTARHQGYDGLLHGGMTSTLLDAAMTHCLFSQGIRALTAELVVRYSKPVKVGEQVAISAFLASERRGIYQLEAKISQAQTILAHAKAKFIQPG